VDGFDVGFGGGKAGEGLILQMDEFFFKQKE
jgi:hypothetical protein